MSGLLDAKHTGVEPSGSAHHWARGLAWALLGWCLGVALQLQQTALWPVWAYVGLLGLLLLGGWLRQRFRAEVRSEVQRGLLPSLRHGVKLAAWVATVSFAITGLHALSRDQAIDPALEGRDLEVVGVVQAMPQRQDLGWRFRFRIEQAWQQGPAGTPEAVDMKAGLPAQVYLGWYGKDADLGSAWGSTAVPEPVKAGERWRFRVRLKAPHGHMNPRGFDYELWLWEQGIGATGYVRMGGQNPAPVRLASTWAHPVEAWRQAVRERLLAHLSPPGSDAEAVKRAGVVAALVVGDQAAIDRSDWDVFRATGVAHLMSISGLHVTMFAWLASGLVAWAWRKSALWGFNGALHWPAVHVGMLAGWALAGGYALFSGWGVPAQRTWWMLGVVVVLKLSSRQWSWPMMWLLAGTVVLTWDPWALLQPGFWLSFVAVGVLMAADPQRQASGRFDRPVGFPPSERAASANHASAQRGAWIVSAGGGQASMLRLMAALQAAGLAAVQRSALLLREQFTISLALAPLSLLFFGQVSLVGLLANLLAIPWVTLVVTPLALLGGVWSGAWTLASAALQPLSLGLGFMATWPLASVSTAMPPWGLALLALLGALGLVVKMPLSWKLLCLPLMWPALFWAPMRPAVGSFDVLAADVGQGNAVLVRTATHSLLYDAGPRYSAESDAGHRVLVPLLAGMGERLDVLMLSHRDSDHTGGAAAVLAMQAQAALWSSLEDTHPLHALRPTWTRCQAGQSWVWDGVRFEVLHPLEPSVQSTPPLRAREPKPNEVSCVLRISQGQASVLLTGDVETPQEWALVQSGLQPVDLLLVPHHGSKTSSSPAFLEALQPRLALVQAGYRNRFGHPAPQVVQRYQEAGIPLVSSTQCGAVHWHSDASAQWGCERERRQRYWHHRVPSGMSP
jgi:competence protein ComEC